MSHHNEIPPPFSSSTDFDLDDPDLMLKSATTYIDRGWRVFPLYSITSS
ncbi:MAG: hypothetical protein JO031_08290, partial [Ktedonobacteraceae bacterium]|nr:hypothetical protein [Ktedonobacteraceae bacterium]